MGIELFLSDSVGTKSYLPLVEEGIEWSTERKGVPGKLSFKVLGDDVLCFGEGAAVRMRLDGKDVFFGFVFSRKHDKNRIVSVTAYDQLRYLNNKDTYVYENKTASQLIRMIAADFRLNTGTIEDTGFVIASRVEDNTSLFDMIGNALDLTLQNRKEMFVLFDDSGKLTLKNISSMRVGTSGAFLMVDEETGENFEYVSSIDNSTYNKIKLTYDNEESGKREVYVAQDSSNMNRWGVLQYYDTLSEGEDGKAKADALLRLYNSRTQNLKITNAAGDIRVRAGSLVLVRLALWDMEVKNFMLVEKVTHKFRLDGHFMDLTLRGGDFIG
ncbi:MAG: hydrolase [Lachnospiraceae bacterium]|nr:hydrolase [Lachnospiraceae bacterium]